MKACFVFLSLLLFSIIALADIPLVRAAGTSPLTYANFLHSHPQYISYSEFTFRQLQQNSVQEQKLFKLSDSFGQNFELTLLHLKGIQQEAPLTLHSLRYIRDLSERGLQLKTSAAEQRTLKHWRCKTVALLNEEPVGDNCALQFISLGNIKSRYPQVDKIVIETTQYPARADVTIQLAANTAYHWTLLSDDSSPVRFYGTYEQLLLQNFVFANLVSGLCEGFNSNLEEFSPLAPAQIYFSDQCQKLSHSLPKPQPWVDRNKPWLYAAGAVALGFVAFSMKDKTLVFDSSGLK